MRLYLSLDIALKERLHAVSAVPVAVNYLCKPADRLIHTVVYDHIVIKIGTFYLFSRYFKKIVDCLFVIIPLSLQVLLQAHPMRAEV